MSWITGHKKKEEANQIDSEQMEAVEDLSVDNNGNKINEMFVKVYSPFKNYFNGDAFSISAENSVGPFDILPGHHNFMTLLQPCQLSIWSNEGEEKINISGGIMHVKADKVIIFLDI